MSHKRGSPMQPNVHGIFHQPTGSVQYIIWDPASRACAIIDPVLDFDRGSATFSATSADELLRFVGRHELKVELIVDTHPHADHMSAAAYLSDRTGSPTAIGERVAIVQQMWRERYDLPELPVDGRQWHRLLRHGDTITIGSVDLAVAYAPGHTLASIILYNEDVAFVNDTVFLPDVGTARADFPGGSAAELWQTISAIVALPKQVRLMVGHDYPPQGRTAAWECSIDEQRENIHLAGRSAVDFVAWRKSRDATLPLPDLMLLALQVNLNGGRPPLKAPDGRRFLKVPVDYTHL
ncbi:MBL fold metallo-hydrolase [Rhizobium laguerreae]|nr:MBL fold metallo-hydrolase [Rhizobium laguerreae]NKM22863.1 MBL fold metallo-hydrolase [Rhizobium laguerreae]